VLRVYGMAERLARLEGAELEIVRAASLLHDASPDTQHAIRDTQAETNSSRENHHHSSAEFAAHVLRQEGWPEERIALVQHCIRAHRFRDEREPPRTIEAKVLFDADKLDAIGAIGVARAIGYAIQAGQPAYAPPSQQFLETGELTPGEPHSAYHEYIFKLGKIKERMLTSSGRALADERHRFMVEFFNRLADEMGSA
jgi:uncharacterized protein